VTDLHSHTSAGNEFQITGVQTENARQVVSVLSRPQHCQTWSPAEYASVSAVFSASTTSGALCDNALHKLTLTYQSLTKHWGYGRPQSLQWCVGVLQTDWLIGVLQHYQHQ